MLFGTEGRFWNNIPYILIANAATYPDFHMKFYVHKDCVDYVHFPLLSEPAKVFDNIEIEVIDEPEQGTKFTIWRMKPLWDNRDIDYLFCRDLDYIVTEMERKSVEYFIQNKNKITHCMRCYNLHSIPFMAGLCGFKVQEVFGIIKNKAATFESYLQYGINELHLDTFEDTDEKWVWGCDQKLLGSFFTPMLKEFAHRHLDCPLQTGEKARLTEWNFKRVLYKDYANIEIPKECNRKIMDFSEDMMKGCSFIGQPYISSGWHTNALINLACSEGLQIAVVLKKVFQDHPRICSAFNLDEKKP